MSITVQTTQKLNNKGFCAIYHFWVAYGKVQDRYFSDCCDFFYHSTSYGDKCLREPYGLKRLDKACWHAGVGQQHQKYVLPCVECYYKYHTKVEDKKITEFFAGAREGQDRKVN